MTLREKILHADSGIRLTEIIAPGTLARMPDRVRNPVTLMTVEWLPNRIWGMSFRLGDKTVKLGHKQGHHIAMHPKIHGVSDSAAEEIIRREVEGTVLHEIGHAVFDAVLEPMSQKERRQVLRDLAKIAQSNGPPSTYTGMCVGGRCAGKPMAEVDRLHEMVAESFRWWIADRSGHFTDRYPGWTLVNRWLCQRLSQPERAAA